MLVQAILIGLSAWRLANFLIEENGPFDIFEKIRSTFGVRPGPVEGFWPLLFSCHFCMTVWTSIVSYFLWQIEPALVMILAAMSVSLLADRFIRT